MRGFQKRVVFVKNPDSALFDEAYFVLREGGGGEAPSGQDMVREALHILEKEGGEAPKKRKGKEKEKMSLAEGQSGRFAQGLLLGVSLCGLLSVLLFLLL